MRNLTSIESSNNIIADLEFHLKFADQSTTVIFGKNDIVSLGRVSWEQSFAGGFGRPSNYRITLQSSVDFIKPNLKQLVRGETFLKISVNSDNFTPHAGRVRDIKRFGNNPDLIELQIYDRLLDNNPSFPVESIVDSYSTPHPEISNTDFGYPVYYGKHARPFYMTPVDCDVATLLGPRNVSSANHVSSVWYNFGVIENPLEQLLFNKSWSQQSGGTNECTGGEPFEFRDGQGAETKLIAIDGSRTGPQELSWSDFSTASVYDSVVGGYAVAEVGKGYVLSPVPFWPPPEVDREVRVYFSAILNLEVQAVTKMSFSNVTLVRAGTGYVSRFGATAIIPDGPDASVFSVNCGTFIGEVDVKSSHANGILNNRDNYLSFSVREALAVGSLATQSDIQLTTSIDMSYRLKSEAFKNYSVYAAQVNCSEIAISENPVAILGDMFDQSSINYVTSQFSQGRTETSSYNLQCFFGEREPITGIVDEFGRISGSYLWVGDSGFMNYRSYQESATAVVDATITSCDYSLDSFEIMDNPLGTTTFETQKTRRVKIDYKYDFSTGNFNGNITADRNNNVFCNSADASGISGEISLQSKYILESDTASLYLQNVIRQTTQDETIVQMNLPARFFGLELNDVVKVQHPALQNSESLFQITRIEPDYLSGNVSIKANELLSL